MQKINIKTEARKIINELPDNADWDDLMYKLYVHKSITQGLEDSKNRKIISVKDVRSQYGLQ